MSQITNKKRSVFDYVGLLLILVLVIFYRYTLLINYSFLYTDSDQNIMWGALNDYANGHFYEPRFYGQNYNTFLEALLAVPLFKMGYQAYTALPFVSMCLCLFPFFYLGFFTFLKRSVFYGLLITSMPLLLPFEYGIITSMPRGFVTGLPFAAIACTGIFYEKEKRYFFLVGIMSIVAYTINSNSILLCVPAVFYLFLENVKNKRFYIYVGLGVLIGAAFNYAMNYVYVSDAFYNTHQFSLSYKWENLLKGLNKMDVFFDYNTPIFWQSSLSTLVIILLIALFFIQQKQFKKAISIFIILPMLLLTLGINKIHDGTSSIYFHYARMYLSLPLLVCLSFCFITPRFEPKIYLLFLFIHVHHFNIHLNQLGLKIHQLNQKKLKDVVIVSKVKPILNHCKSLNDICKKNKIDLFVVVNHYYADAYASGCKSCEEDFPITLNASKERRTWRMREIDKNIYKNIMFIDLGNKIDTNLTFIKKIPESVDLYLVKNNTRHTFKLLDTLGISYRAFK